MDIKNLADGAAAVRTAADARAAVETKKYAAAKESTDVDKFAKNASSPYWSGGFDQLLNSKRTS